MSTAPTAPVTPAFTLEPPEVITPVAVETAREAVPLKPELQKQVDDQVVRFIDALANEDVHSDAFKQRLDSAFALGKEEISNASSLMQGRFMNRNFAGIEDSPAKGRAALCQHLGQRVFVDVGDRHLQPARRQCIGNAQPDAAGPARDERVFCLCQFHNAPLLYQRLYQRRSAAVPLDRLCCAHS